MFKDPRYGTIKILIESGHITSIREIFTFIPKTTVYKDLGINYNRFDNAIIDPSIFKLQELIVLAHFFDVDARKFIDMAYNQSLTAKHKAKSKWDEKFRKENITSFAPNITTGSGNKSQ